MAHQSKGAFRLLLTWRWIGITALVILLSAVFAVASSWQYHRAIDQVNAARAVSAAPEPISTLVPDGAAEVPADSLGRDAVAGGQYVADVWVIGRQSAGGEPGVWLVSALDDGSGVVTAVLRGWLPQRAETGSDGVPVTVTGRVSSPENFYNSIAPTADEGLMAITQDGLEQAWNLPIRAGYVVLAEQSPGLQPDDPRPVPSVFGNEAHVEFPWQNAAYALQWLIFIGFAGFMYWRLFRDDLRDLREADAADPASEPVSA